MKKVLIFGAVKHVIKKAKEHLAKWDEVRYNSSTTIRFCGK